MTTNENYTAVPVFRDTWKRLNSLKTSRNTFDQIINRLLDLHYGVAGITPDELRFLADTEDVAIIELISNRELLYKIMNPLPGKKKEKWTLTEKV